MDDLATRVSAFITESGMLDGVDCLLVGFSGGPDSTALLLLLAEHDSNIEAVHLHHGLRADAADGDRDWCRAFCAHRNIPFSTTELDVPAHRLPGESVEMAARRQRLEYWADRAADDESTVVALGHHLDDRLETFLQRLFRSSNASGLCGLRNISRVAGVRFVRPLLCIRRQEILSWLEQRGVNDYRVDASNTDESIDRNRIRAQLTPLFETFNTTGALASLDLLEQDALCLERQAAALLGDTSELSIDILQGADPCMWPRLLRQWGQRQYGFDLTLRRAAIERLRNVLDRASDPCQIDIDGRFFLQFEKGRLYLRAKDSEPDAVFTWKWREQVVLETGTLRLESRLVEMPADRCGDDSWSEYWDTEQLGDELTLRPRQPGDRMLPFGSDQVTRVKKLLSNSPLGGRIKRSLPIVCHVDGTILWVPGVRRAAAARVTAESCEVVQVTCQLLPHR
jgi:tRNA(Ile)-lysidine synthase